jgi:nitroreductase/NAD-dependent dihydropyrimidine dehydrogenase PreA subunit
MSRILIDQDLCLRDGACVEVCPARYLAQDPDGVPVEVAERNCILCGHCVAVCPNGAFTHNELPDAEFLPVLAEWPNAATIDGFLNSRRSVREFKPEPVDRPTLEALLDVARRAPSASNSQKLQWIVVSGVDQVRAIASKIVACGRISGVHPALLAQWDAGYDFVLRNAPTLVIACAPEEYRWGKEDGAIAVTFLELAAEARGLGACWAGYLTRVAEEHESLRNLLHVPAGFAVRGGLMLGHGTHVYSRIPPRKPLTAHWIG